MKYELEIDNYVPTEDGSSIESVIPAILETSFDSMVEDGMIEDYPTIGDVVKVDEDWKNKYMYLAAEYDNYRKRTTKERQDLLKYKENDILTDIIPVYELFNKALQYNNDEGVAFIFNSLNTMLKNHEFMVMNVNVGDAFDVDTMEAISTLHTDDESLNNTVCDIVHNGYIYKDKVIKYAQVIVYQN